MDDQASTAEQRRLQRIAQARGDLAARYAADPEAVDRFEARKARLSAAAKRERERVDHLVLGKKRPDPELKKPAGMSRQEWKVEKERLRKVGAQLTPGIEEAVELRDAWSHKAGTPETLAHAAGTHQDAIHQMQANGTLDAEQVEWVAQIANVHRSIESDVTVAVASLEARVDQSRSGQNLVGESIRRVRLHRAYTFWREALPDPKRLVLDMIVGDTIGYTVAARRYGVHNRKAKRLLVEAIDRWPGCVDRAYRLIGADMHAELNEAR